jgi:hypothetical protein
MIKAVSQPVWVPSKRQWKIVYTVLDGTIGEYQQVVWCEALVSAERIIKEIKSKIR